MFTRGYLEIPGNFRTGKMGPGSVIGSYHDLTAMEIIPKWAKNGCDLRSFTPKLLPIVCHNPKSSFQVHLYDKGTVFVAWLHDFHYLSILPAGALYARRRSRTGNYGYVSWKKVTSSRDYPLNVVHDKQFQLKTDISPTDWRYWIHLNAERLAYEPILNGIYKIRS